MKIRTSKITRSQDHSRGTSGSFMERLEDRRLLFAAIPAGYVRIETIQIRPKAGTYNATTVLDAKTAYFLVATGTAVNSLGNSEGDAAFPASGTAATTWGISVTDGATTSAATGWGSAPEGDHRYGQTFTPAAAGAPTFTFANDAKDVASTLAVSIYGPAPSISVAKIKNNKASGTIVSSVAAPATVFLPINNADWDKNGIADDLQKTAVTGDQYLLPITLPAVTSATSKSHYVITAPKGLHVWLNADRTGPATGVGLRATKSRIVYLEATGEQPKHALQTLKIMVPFDGVTGEQDVKVSVFNLSGPIAAPGGSKQIYSSDAISGTWTTATGGTLDAKHISKVHGKAFANVTWTNATASDFAYYQANANYIWGVGVAVTKV